MKINKLFSTLISSLVSAAANMNGDTKNVVASVAQRLTNESKKLKGINFGTTTSSTVPTARPQKAPTTVTQAQIDTAKKFQKGIASKFQKNGNTPIVMNLATKGEIKHARSYALAAATQHLTMALGTNGKVMNVILAPKGSTIPKNLFRKGFSYANAVQQGKICGIPKTVLATKPGKVLIAAVKPVMGLKLVAHNS